MEPESSRSNQSTDYKILGLDVGIASVGAAVLNLGEEMIEGLYVRAFDKAEVAKTGESLNAVRREARGVRRRLRRRRLRLADTTTLVESSQGDLPLNSARLGSRQRHGRSGLGGSTVHSPRSSLPPRSTTSRSTRGSRPTAGTPQRRTTTGK